MTTNTFTIIKGFRDDIDNGGFKKYYLDPVNNTIDRNYLKKIYGNSFVNGYYISRFKNPVDDVVECELIPVVIYKVVLDTYLETYISVSKDPSSITIK